MQKVNVIDDDGKYIEDDARSRSGVPMPSVSTMTGPKSKVRAGFKMKFKSERMRAVNVSPIKVCSR